MLSETNKTALENAIKANHDRGFYTAYPEHPKAYGEEAQNRGYERFQSLLSSPFTELLQEGAISQTGEEASPYTMKNLEITYPRFESSELINRSSSALKEWRKVEVDRRADILIQSLEAIKENFFDIAFATQHTTGQSFMMSFQASGPHANDRAIEALAFCYEELTQFPKEVVWDKPMGKFNIKLQKRYNPVPKGIGLVIGCSTFPVWNTLPGVYANLMAGNTVIVKPHPKSVLPIAIAIAEIQKTLKNAGMNPETIQLAVDSTESPLTLELAEDPQVKLIDYTGSSQFGEVIEKIPGKTIFTEKAGVNSVLLDSVEDLDKVIQNLSFACCLYSGQMCTAPQNFFIPEAGVKTAEGTVSYEEVVTKLKEGISGLANHPKMGAGTLGAIQNEATLKRAQNPGVGTEVLAAGTIENAEFPGARMCTPAILEVDASDTDQYEQELFGPIILVIKTKDSEDSLNLIKSLGEKKGAISCALYSTDDTFANHCTDELEEAFIPTSLNLTGFIWVNQHAAFSDFHVTGGNPAGNASFANADFVGRRFVWVGHRRLV